MTPLPLRGTTGDATTTEPPNTATPGSLTPCACGHIAGEHHTNRAGWPHPITYGYCHNCNCVEYRQATT